MLVKTIRNFLTAIYIQVNQMEKIEGYKNETDPNVTLVS